MLLYYASQFLLFFSKRINAALKILIRRSLYSGTITEKANSEKLLDKSAHTLNVLYRCSLSPVSSPNTRDFFLVHKSYSDPRRSILQNPRVSLMNIYKDKALFAVMPEGFNVYDPKHGPFFYHVQYQYCQQIIELPLPFMLPLAQELPSHNNTKVILYNTGRCGSTLLTQMLTSIPTIEGISEPDSLLHGSPTIGFQERARLLGAILRLQCKDLAQNVILKPRSEAIYYMAEQSVASPNTKLIFMYRDPLRTIASFTSMLASLPKLFLKLFLPKMVQLIVERTKHMSSIFNHALLQSRMEAAAANFDMVDMFTLKYISNIAGYLYAKKRGATIHVIKYETLLADPSAQIQEILDFCGIPASLNDLARCLSVMNKDSQEGHVFARKKSAQDLADDRNGFASQYEAQINETFRLFGFPNAQEFDSIFA